MLKRQLNMFKSVSKLPLSTAFLLASVLFLQTAAQDDQPRKSPFSSDGQINWPKVDYNGQDKLKKSPFTPPPSADNSGPSFRNPPPRVVASNPPRTRPPQEVQQPSTPAQEERQKSKRKETTKPKPQSDDEGENEDYPWPAESPFKPPTTSEWREDQENNQPANRGDDDEEQQQRPQPDQRRSQRRQRPGGSPRVSVYQDGQPAPDRDMHEAAPGVTPWTRYTARPRVRGEEDDNGSSGSRARCGSKTYFPRSQICCQGQPQRRQGMKPSCCGRQSYDSAYNKCCNGVVSLRSDQDPDCP